MQAFILQKVVPGLVQFGLIGYIGWEGLTLWIALLQRLAPIWQLIALDIAVITLGLLIGRVIALKLGRQPRFKFYISIN